MLQQSHRCATPAGLPADSDNVYCTSGVSNACYFYNDTAATYVNAKASCAAQGGILVAYNSAKEQVSAGRARRSRCKRNPGILRPAAPHPPRSQASECCAACVQLTIEKYFYGSAGTGAMSSTYWVGLERTASPAHFYWLDGTDVGHGAVSNADPYAHFSYDFFDIESPTANCTTARASRAYANYTGGFGSGTMGAEMSRAVSLQHAAPGCCRQSQHRAPLTRPTAGQSSEYLQSQVNSATYYSDIAALNTFGWYPVSCSSAYQYVCEVPFSALGCKAPPPVPPPYPPAQLCLPPDNDVTSGSWLALLASSQPFHLVTNPCCCCIIS